MINQISIGAPTQVGGGANLLSVRVTITLSGVITSDMFYYFVGPTVSCIYDTVYENMAVVHFGNHHSFQINNAEYNTWIYDGTPKSSPIEAAQALIEAIGALV